jgi:C1A family cysteine protease
LKPIIEMVKANNKNYQLGLTNFQSAVYWFSHLSSDQIRAQLLGAIPPAAQKEPITLPLLSVNGTVSSQTIYRRKRAVTTTAGPECTNLPAYKNWAEEGKTSPVQNQGSCGNIEL